MNPDIAAITELGFADPDEFENYDDVDSAEVPEEGYEEFARTDEEVND